MIYGDDIWHTITHTRGITGFVGPKGRPLALTQEEIRKLPKLYYIGQLRSLQIFHAKQLQFINY